MKDNEVKAYTVAIPNLPVFPNKRVKMFLKDIRNMEGFIGMHPCYPNGTLLVWKTEADAKRARNRILQQYRNTARI